MHGTTVKIGYRVVHKFFRKFVALIKIGQVITMLF